MDGEPENGRHQSGKIQMESDTRPAMGSRSCEISFDPDVGPGRQKGPHGLHPAVQQACLCRILQADGRLHVDVFQPDHAQESAQQTPGWGQEVLHVSPAVLDSLPQARWYILRFTFLVL